VLYFFPSERTLQYLENMNDLISRGQIDLSDYSLSVPVTINELIDNRKEMKRFMSGYDQIKVSMIFELPHK